MQLHFHIINFKFEIKLSQQQDIMRKLYQKSQMQEIKTDKNLIDNFCQVTGVNLP